MPLVNMYLEEDTNQGNDYPPSRPPERIFKKMINQSGEGKKGGKSGAYERSTICIINALKEKAEL